MVVSNIFYFHPYLGKIPILINIFQLGWNHQLDIVFGRRTARGCKSWKLVRFLWGDPMEVVVSIYFFFHPRKFAGNDSQCDYGAYFFKKRFGEKPTRLDIHINPPKILHGYLVHPRWFGKISSICQDFGETPFFHGGKKLFFNSNGFRRGKLRKLIAKPPV